MEHFRIKLLPAVWTDAVAELVFRVIHQVAFDRQPGPIAVTNLFAAGTDGNVAADGVNHDFFEGNKASIQHSEQLDGKGRGNPLNQRLNLINSIN